MELNPWNHLSEERLGGFLNDSKNNENAPDRKIIINYLRESFGKPRLLDVGSGTGHQYLAMKKSGMEFEYLGVDKTDKMVEFARKKFPEAKFIQGDVHKLPFADRSWPVVYCRHVLAHLSGYEKALSEIARVTKDCLIICLLISLGVKQQIKVLGKPPSQTKPDEFNEHYLNTYERGPFMGELENLGFNVAVDKLIGVGGYFKYYELIIAKRRRA